MLVYVIIHVAVDLNILFNKMQWFHQNTQVHVILSLLWARGEQRTKVANGTPMNAMTGMLC